MLLRIHTSSWNIFHVMNTYIFVVSLSSDQVIWSSDSLSNEL